MNPTPEDARVSGAGTPAAIPTHIAARIDDTLRLIAMAPVPTGLEERVHAALETAPRRTRILPWPTGAWPSSMRAAAAAAIVAVVTGGGWGVYTRVQHLARTGTPVAPQLVQPAGGFSSAGAIRTPQTVQGPAVHPEEKKPDRKKRDENKPPERDRHGAIQPPR